MKKYSLLLLGCLIIFSCTKESETVDYVAIPLEVALPDNFPDIVYNLDNNPVTEAGFELGKDLFYEGKLSVNDAIPCAFCHEQAFAFTHHGHNLSHGVNGGVGFRNAQPIQNLAYQTSFMWNGAASHLDLQPIIPITAEVEMGETLSNVISKLSADSQYQEKFARAFEDGEVSTENMLKALSQFMVMMVSSNSKYDKYVRQEDNVTLTTIELDGLNTFQQKCATCHATDLFTDQTFRNNGLPVNPLLNDTGRFEILEDPNDLYKFKVPSLRNVEVSGPYMHDGRFTTLEVVLDFYDSGAVDNGNVDPLLLRADGTYGISLNDYEKESLISFLKTLTDNEYLNDERFSEY
ncbi:cytochrome-c peroxidase [Lacinutrix sp. C3R15]|uniref:cytochrome-c peroxidase n=1 Tax=Flavobacteriaceae TaxID=49546 RepID=UPI001C0A6396|nr:MULTISPECIES: cytochrome c peroxidase [Flavobacteriaceae]MBU2940780.1 cytochrome-c peroxidase [Lacinutrix sp. C3R15]MDO6624098.1 cytochrome c peroxidase [Oceanihabitans sp. 1_MG-2023]